MPPTRVPASLVLSQTSVSLDALGATVQLAATIRDQNEQVLTEESVSFSSSAPEVAAVSESGVITAVSNGTAVITAASGSLTATVSVTVAQVIRRLAKEGDAQSGFRGEPLPIPLAVEVRDGRNNAASGPAITGVSVNFAVTAGGGSVGQTRVALGANGRAATEWTLGDSVGARQAVTATLAGGSLAVNLTVTFTATFTLPTLSRIISEMTAAAATFPAIAEVVDLTARYATPPTHDGRSLYAVKISDNVGLDEDEPRFLLVAAHHGNERSTPIVALDAIARLTKGYGSDSLVTRLVDELEIWVAPIWNPDGYVFDSRKNGRPNGGVDLNRNYPFLWDSTCSGSRNPASSRYKGPAPASEPETQTMIAFSEDRRFTKVLDVHTTGRSIAYGYGCPQHRLLDYLQSEAGELSFASSYDGRTFRPDVDGLHYQWQLGNYSNYAFVIELLEAGTSHSYVVALEEAARVWPGTLWMMSRPIPVRGHVTDASTGAPLEASIQYIENRFTQGEQNRSEPHFGRYHAFLPLGTHTLSFSVQGYVTQEAVVFVTETGVELDIALMPGSGRTQSAPQQ